MLIEIIVSILRSVDSHKNTRNKTLFRPVDSTRIPSLKAQPKLIHTELTKVGTKSNKTQNILIIKTLSRALRLTSNIYKQIIDLTKKQPDLERKNNDQK